MAARLFKEIVPHSSENPSVYTSKVVTILQTGTSTVQTVYTDDTLNTAITSSKITTSSNGSVIFYTDNVATVDIKRDTGGAVTTHRGAPIGAIPPQLMAFGDGIESLDPAEVNLSSTQSMRTSSAGVGLGITVEGGYCWVEDSNLTANGMWLINHNSSGVVIAGAAHATLPRIDTVYAQVNDTGVSNGWANSYTIGIAAGTATSGATLTNLTGLATLSNKQLPLGYWLVPATFTGPFVNGTHRRDARYFAYKPGRCIGRGALQATSIGSGAKITVACTGKNARVFEVLGNCGQAIQTSGGIGALVYLQNIDSFTGTVFGGSYDTNSTALVEDRQAHPKHSSVTPSTSGVTSRYSFELTLNTSLGTPAILATTDEPAFLIMRYI